MTGSTRARVTAIRNRLGRLVVHVEKKKGIVPIKKSMLELMYPKLTKQVSWLESRLEQLGGEVVTEDLFMISGSPAWCGFTNGDIVWFKKSEADRIISWLNSTCEHGEIHSYYDVHNQGYILGWELDTILGDDTKSIHDIIIRPDADGHYVFPGIIWHTATVCAKKELNP